MLIRNVQKQFVKLIDPIVTCIQNQRHALSMGSLKPCFSLFASSSSSTAAEAAAAVAAAAANNNSNKQQESPRLTHPSLVRVSACTSSMSQKTVRSPPLSTSTRRFVLSPKESSRGGGGSGGVKHQPPPPPHPLQQRRRPASDACVVAIHRRNAINTIKVSSSSVHSSCLGFKMK